MIPAGDETETEEPTKPELVRLRGATTRQLEPSGDDLASHALHQRHWSGRDPDAAGETELAAGPDEEAASGKGFGERDVVHADVDEEEVRLRRAGLGSGRLKALCEPLAPRFVRQPSGLDELGVQEARPACGEGGPVDVEGLEDDVDHGGSGSLTTA